MYRERLNLRRRGDRFKRMRSRRPFLLLCVCLLAGPLAAAEPRKNPSGLPVPRFVALKSGEINVRTGPGTRYPIDWVYKREALPVEVIDEFDHWRRVKDSEGAMGWVHKSMLDGRRTALIRAKTPQNLLADPEDKAKPILRAEPMVIGKLLECKKEWCRLQLSGRKGWIKKAFLWGVYQGEEF